MQDYYAARAREYDRVYEKPERQAADLAAMKTWLAQALRGRSVLEIAWGTGWWTQHYSVQARAVLATDAVVEPLTIARERMTGLSGVAAHVEMGLRPCHFLQADAFELPLPALAQSQFSPFDALFAGFWWSHVPRQTLRSFLQGLHRALPSGALAVFMDNCFVAGSSTAIERIDEQGNSWQHRVLADGSEHRVMKNFPDEAEARAVLAGLVTDLCWYRWPHFWALCYHVA